jgi:DNA-binding GntR family transcriptional regulator
MPRRSRTFEAANRAFHRALVAPCAMPRLLASLDGLQLANFSIGIRNGAQCRLATAIPIRITA